MAVTAGGFAAAVVWQTLVSGGGLVGGDTYPYFFPQKQVLAEALRRGEFPLWHDRTGLGYPLHAESQAGVFYPSNQLLYRLLDVNQAYSLSIVLHYWASFVLTWRFARTQRLSQWSALLAAVVFVYGWFPARISLEWSIIGGVWFPASLWMTDRLLNHPSRRSWAMLAGCVGMHLLAGHFALAFITQLTCCGYAGIRVWQQPRRSAAAGRQGSAALPSANSDEVPSVSSPAVGLLAMVVSAIVAGILLASVQLLPTTELKRLSQREGVSTAFDPGYGHLPPVYLTQLFASWWLWHTPESVTSRELSMYPLLSISSATNQVEAHLYFGLIPLGLAAMSFRRHLLSRRNRETRTCWLLLSVCAIVYAFGWLIPLTRHLPGFGFFMGPGRYTIVASMGAAIISGLSLDALLARRRRLTRSFVCFTVCLLTLVDVLLSSRYPVSDAVAVSQPPLAGLTNSWVRQKLQQIGTENVRLLAPGPNVANLYGVSCVPQYLGLGPAEYYEDEKTYRTQPDKGEREPFPSPEELIRLVDRGVTHILATEAFPVPSEEIELIHAEPDTFLNAVWGRGTASCFLYRLRDSPQRVFADDPERLLEWNWLHRTPSDVTVEVRLQQDATVGLRELMFPGWEVHIDGHPAAPLIPTGFSRLVHVRAGTHVIRWIYRPQSTLAGFAVSLTVTIVLLFLIFHRRNPHAVQCSQTGT